MRRLLIVLALMTVAASSASAADIFVSQAGGGAGTSCASPRAVSSLAGGDWTAGNTIHLCGAMTGALGGNLITVTSNGSSGNPITILFETGASLSSPAWGSNGAINISGRQWITIDGGTNGIIQNTANGDQLANRLTGTFINATNTQHADIKNLTLANSYVAVQNFGNPLGGSATNVNVITISGQNNHIHLNTLHDCSWCILNFYGNGDTNLEIDHNDVYRYNHYIASAAPAANVNISPALIWHDDKIHDNLNWESVVPALSTLSCTYHQDGIHMYSISGSSSTDGIYIYNNYFYGQNSACTTGFIFVEGGGSNARVINGAMWNNVFDATGFDTITGLTAAGCTPAAPCGPLGGLIDAFTGSGSWTVVNNTAYYINAYTSGTQGYNIGSVNNLIFKNNVSNGFVPGNNLGSLTSTPSSQVNNNFYGSACIISNNCFIYNQTFRNSFAGWLSASGFDATPASGHTSTFSGALLNSDGSPQTNSPVINFGANLTPLCVGQMVSLCNDTTLGGTRTPVARPSVGAWNAGAYQTLGTAPPNPPTGLAASVSGSTVTLTGTPSTTVPAPTGYNLYRGTVHGGPYSLIKTALSSPNTTDTPPNGSYFYVETAFVGGLVSTISGNGTTATVTCMTACPSFSTGTAFTIFGDSVAGFNGTFTSTSQPTSSTFTFSSSTNSVGSGGAAWPTTLESVKSNEVQATVPAALTVSFLPASRTFGSFTVGTPSPSQTATLTNTSAPGQSVTISSKSFTGANAGDYSQTNNCPGILTSGSSCTFNITFTPTAAGTRTANLTVVDNASGSPHTVAVTGTGVAAAPGVNLSPASLNFGDQTLSTTSTARSIILTNTGSGTLTVTSVTASGDFAVTTVPVTNCGGSLAPLATCSLNVTFTPTATGGRTGSVTVVDNATGSPHVAGLTGTGITTKCAMTGAVTLSGVGSVCQ